MFSPYASVSSKHQYPLPRQPPGFCTYFQPRSQDLYHLNGSGVARGSGLLSVIISTKLSVDAVMRHISASNWSIICCCFLVTKFVSKLGKTLKWSSMVTETIGYQRSKNSSRNFQVFDKIPKFQCQLMGKADKILKHWWSLSSIVKERKQQSKPPAVGTIKHLLTDCMVNAEKYLDCSSDVRAKPSEELSSEYFSGKKMLSSPNTGKYCPGNNQSCLRVICLRCHISHGYIIKPHTMPWLPSFIILGDFDIECVICTTF